MPLPNTDAPVETVETIAALPIRKITELLIEHHGLKEGFYEPIVEFVIATGHVGPQAQDALPSAIIGVSKIGLMKTETETPTCVDASKVGKRTGRKRKTT